jgi:peroxiredoxin
VEYPHLQELYAKLGGKDFVIVSIDNRNKPEENAPFIAKVGATFPILLDDRNVSRDIFKIKGTPTNLVIDREGRIVFRHLGYSPGDEKVLEAEIESLMKTDLAMKN